MDIRQNAHKTTIRQRNLIFLDIETTGLEVQKHEIIEIGALKVAPKKPFKILRQLDIKVQPKHIERASQDALKINGYSKKEWQDAVSLRSALRQLDMFAQDGILVGYNVSFDWAFLDCAYFSLGKQDPFYYHRLDVMPMAYIKLFPKRSLKRFSLGEVSNYFKIQQDVKHRALDDAKTTYLIFKQLFDVQ